MTSLSDAGLAQFPFRTVPPNNATHIWADRSSFRKELVDLVRSWTHKPNSGIYLLWADFGAGKTHALRYLQAIAPETTPPSILVYCDLPESTSNFLEVARQIVPQIPERVLVRAIERYRQNLGESWLSDSLLAGDRETPQILWMLAEMGSQLRGEVARRWLRGDKLGSRESALIDYIPSIKTSERAIRVVASICRIVLRGGEYARLVLMFDEFQRIGQVSRKKIDDINAGINTLYNSCPEGLAIILSYSFGVPENIKFMVSGEVLSRVDQQFNLRFLSEGDAAIFVRDTVNQSMIDGSSVEPFTDSAIRTIVGRLSSEVGEHLTPRLVMQRFGRLLDRALAADIPATFPLDADAAVALDVSAE